MEITQEMIRALGKKYPGCNIVCLPQKNPQEVVCEIAKAPDGSWSLAVALITKSVPHFHKTTHESYRVLDGCVRMMDGTERGKFLTPVSRKNTARISAGFESILPGQLHCAWAIGDSPATVLVLASPAWSPKDHHLKPKIKPFKLDPIGIPEVELRIPNS